MWGPNDIPPQRPEHEGTPVDYKTDGNGAVHEVPAAWTNPGLPWPAPAAQDESKRMVPRDAPTCAPGFGADSLNGSNGADDLGQMTEDDLLRGLEGLNPPCVAADERLARRIELQREERSRRYMPTLAELIDRMAICQLKAIFIPESRAEYDREIADIVHDVDLILDQKSDSGFVFGAEAIRAAMVIMLTNRYIWENESLARAGSNGQDHLLKLTHSINGVRNTAKNELSKLAGDRIDLKIDCFAAELIERFGNWNIYGSSGAA